MSSATAGRCGIQSSVCRIKISTEIWEQTQNSEVNSSPFLGLQLRRRIPWNQKECSHRMHIAQS